MDRFEEAKNKIKEATDLVELVQGYAPLTRAGRYFKGLCPFHDEKTPSFTVHPDTQHFKCFGCGVAGDVFTFLMDRDGVTFREAMEQLAESAGVSLEGVFGQGKRPRGPKVDVHGALDQVREFFGAHLRSADGRAGREYLADRDLLAAIDDFDLGLHPTAQGALRAFAEQRKLPTDVLVQAGVLGRDGRREPLLGRLVFPIMDERGRIVGFGGRVLPGMPADRPKYVNSPESPFFNKRRLLYGLRQVKDAGTRRVVVVEGYTDVIACHLAGLTGAVATLGTALTLEHAKLLERYALEGVVLVFDGDRAGRQAADRAFRELVHTRLNVKMVLLPEGSDPADLCKRENDQVPSRLETLLEGADDAVTTWFRLLRQRFDLTNDADAERAAAECTAILAEIESDARREALAQNMARYLGLQDSKTLRPARLRPRRGAGRSSGGGASGASGSGRRGTGGGQSGRVDYVSSVASGGGGGPGGDFPEVPFFDDPSMQPPLEAMDFEALEAGATGPAVPASSEEGAGPVGSGQGGSRVGGSGVGGPGRGGGGRSAGGRPAGPRPGQRPPPKLIEADLDLVACLAASPALLDEDAFEEVVEDGTFVVPRVDEVLRWIDAARLNGAESLDAIAPLLFTRAGEDRSMARFLAEAVDRAKRIRDPQSMFLKLRQDRKAQFVKEEVRRTRVRLQAALADGDQALYDELTAHYLKLLQSIGSPPGPA